MPGPAFAIFPFVTETVNKYTNNILGVNSMFLQQKSAINHKKLVLITFCQPTWEETNNPYVFCNIFGCTQFCHTSKEIHPKRRKKSTKLPLHKLPGNECDVKLNWWIYMNSLFQNIVCISNETSKGPLETSVLVGGLCSEIFCKSF